MREIKFEELPPEAQAGISEEQKTYLDEFTFYWKDGHIEAYYAGEVYEAAGGEKPGTYLIKGRLYKKERFETV